MVEGSGVIHIFGVSPAESLGGNDGDDLRGLDDHLVRRLAAQPVGDRLKRLLFEVGWVDVNRHLKLGTHLALDLHHGGDGVMADVLLVGDGPRLGGQGFVMPELGPHLLADVRRDRREHEDQRLNGGARHGGQ